MAKTQAEDKVTHMELLEADHGFGLGSSLLRLELFLFFFLELEMRFLPHTNVPHVAAGSTDSTPAGEHLIQGKTSCMAEPQVLFERR